MSKTSFRIIRLFLHAHALACVLSHLKLVRTQGRIQTFEKGGHTERKDTRSQAGGLGGAAPRSYRTFYFEKYKNVAKCNICAAMFKIKYLQLYSGI